MEVSLHDQALTRAKGELMSRADSMFFTTVFFSLKFLWDERVPTACTNGYYIKANPKYFLTLTLGQRVFLLVHEAMHVAYLHMARLGDREMRRMNIAADYVINLQLVDQKFDIHPNWLLDRKWAGMSTEQVYDALPENPSEICDMDIEPNDIEPDDFKRDIDDILVRAQLRARMEGNSPGSIPGDIQVYLNGLLKPKLSWKRILQKYLNSYSKSDYSFKKPNRRFFPKYHMPSLHGEALIDLTIAVDISGSVSDHDFHVFVSEVASILRMMKPKKITLVQFDTKIQGIDVIKDIGDLMRCKFTGRGGTLIEPVLTHINETKPQLSLVFSDGGFGFPGIEVKSDLIWLIHNNPGWTAPFGKVIHYEVKK